MTAVSQRSRDVIMLRALSNWLSEGASSPKFAIGAWRAAVDRFIANEYPKEPRNRPPTNSVRNIWIAAACLYRERLIHIKRYAAASQIATECKDAGIRISAASIERLCSTHGKAARKHLKALNISICGSAKPARDDCEKRDKWSEDRLRAEWQGAHALTLSMARK
jgi:hypothetical protein